MVWQGFDFSFIIKIKLGLHGLNVSYLWIETFVYLDFRLVMKWRCYLETTMGYQLVEDDFPTRFNRDDVTKAFEGRYGCKVIQVNPSPI